MSDGFNKVMLLGNLGADPELRYGQNGGMALSFRMATNESWLDKDRQLQERTEWHNVVIFGGRAETLSRVLMKGTGVVVEGALRTSSYEKDGQKKYKTEVVARSVWPVGGPMQGRGDPGGLRRDIDDEIPPSSEERRPPLEEEVERPSVPERPRSPRKKSGAVIRAPELMEEMPY